MKRLIGLVLLGISALTASAIAQNAPFPLMVTEWGYTKGAGGTPVGVLNWPNGEGSLTVSGTQGTNTLTINSVNVGVIADYNIDTAFFPAGWAMVVPGGDGVLRVYTVYAVNTSGMTLSVYPELAAPVNSQLAANLYDGSGPHLTTLGYYGYADFVVAQTKNISYLQQYAARAVSDGLGNYSGSWTAIDGLNQGAGGNVPPTNCMTEGVFPYTSNVDAVICSAYSGPDRTEVNGSVYQTLIGSATAGQGATLTASLYGKSGYLDTFVGIEGQYGSEQASARVVVTIDGNQVLNENFGGLTHIQVPFIHAQSGAITVTVDSPYPCAPRISNTNWFVWNDSDWNGVSPTDPLMPNGSKILALMDSNGTYHNAAFVTRLQQDLPASSITNVSQPSKTTSWAIQNFSTLTAGGPYDYIISDFQVNDLSPSITGNLTFVQLLTNLDELWSMVLGTGATPIYLRSHSVTNMPETQRMNQWDQTLTANYPTQTQPQQPQTITFPNPGTEGYGVAPITLTATASSGLPVSYTVISGPAMVNGNVLTITGAGSVTVEANQSGNSQWQAAPPVDDSFTVNPAVLTVTANNASMTYGGTLPTLSVSYTGFVNGDGQGVLSGSPSLTTTATPTSPVGSYPIVAAQGTLSAQNYSFAFVNGVLTIVPAPSSAVVTSTLTTLFSTQATTLTATVSVLGAGGAPTGAVNFMLGNTQLGSATLSATDGNDAMATLQVEGAQLSVGQNNITAVYAGDNNYQGATSPAIAVTVLSSQQGFGAVSLGTSAPVATLTYTFSSDAQLSAINILTAGTAGLDYQDGGSSTCQTGVPYTSGQSCTVTVAFTPAAPGLRAGSVTLFAQGSNQPLMTWYVSGVGQSAAVTIDPGTQTTLATITNAAAYGSVIDGAGNVYVADQANGQVVEIAAGTQTQTLVASQLSAPTSVVLDGAGNLYIAQSSGVAMIPNENGTLNAADLQSLPIAGLGLAQGVAEDGNGNLYVADSGTGNVLEIPGGYGRPQVIASGLTNPHGVAVDAAGNVYVASDNQVTEYPAGGGTAIPMGTGYVTPQAVAVDASGTVYVADTGNAQVVKVAPGGQAQSVIAMAGLTAPRGVTVDAMGDLYVSDGSNVYEMNRVLAAQLNFGQVEQGSNSPAQTLTVTNIGNQQLTASGLSITGDYQQQASGGTDCSGSSQLLAGGGCAIAVIFSPTTQGVLNGTVTLADNALNNPASQQTVALTGTGTQQQQQPQTITFPNPGTQSYGVAPITLTATASSGLPVTYTVISGPAAINGSLLMITGAGAVTVEANQSGNDQWQAAPPVDDSFTVNPAVLTVTANNASMTYGGTLPTLSVSYTGFVNGDGQGVLSGSPSLTTTATPTSPVGSYPIIASQGTLSAQNYSFAFVNGVLTIAQAPSSAVVTSTLTTLFSTQATTLTATVSVLGAGGAPTGAVNFMLGNTQLGSATLTATDGTDATATLQVEGAQLTVGQNNITAVYAGDNNYQGATSPAITVTVLSSQQSFGAVSLGTTSPVVTLTYTFSSDAQLSAINILTLGTAGLDYQDGGSSTCQTGVPYSSGQSCNVTVAFTPSAPGLRAGSVTLFAEGSNQPLMTWYLSGVGQSAAVTIDPGTQTTLATITNAAVYGSVIDGAGNIYVADQANGQVVEIAAGTQTQSVVASQLSAPTSVALDGAGNLYIAQSSGVVMIPNENGTLNAADMQSLPIAGLGLAQGIAEDGNGNLYIADSGTGNVLEIPGGYGAPQVIATGLTNPHGVTVDAAGNVYVASDNQVTEYPAGGGTAIPMGTGYVQPQAVAVDASGTVYVADTGNAQVVKVAPGGQAQSVIAVTGLVAPRGITVDTMGDLYVSDGSNVYEMNRVLAAQLNFGQVEQGSNSPAQTLTVTNIGNQQLTASGLSITGDYQQQASGGTDCSGSSQLLAGGGCAIAVIFSPTTQGVLNGTVTLADNALNNPASQQTVALTGTGTQLQQQPQTITFPNPGTEGYGVAPLTLTATASSRLPVSYTVISGPAMVNGNVLTITGAGSVTVEANQSGNDQWLPAPPVDDSFTVNPAVLTVTANNASMTYGGTLPTLSVSYTGFVNGDGQGVLSGSPSLTTTATPTSPVGSYPIVAAQGTLSAQNYSFAFVNGVLTINPAVLTVTANNASMTYGGMLPAFSVSYSGFVNGDGQGVLSGSPSLTTTASSTSPVGNYAITVAQGTLSAQNYTFNFVNGTLTVNPAVLTVTANNASRQYGQQNPTFTYTMTGFLNGDTQGTATSGQPSLTTTATTTSPLGSYPIVVAQGTLTAQSYTFVFVNGTLTISQASTMISWTPLTYTVSAGQPLGAAGVLDAAIVPNIAGTMVYTTVLNGHFVSLLPNMGLPVGVFRISASFTPQDEIDYAVPTPVSVTITVTN